MVTNLVTGAFISLYGSVAAGLAVGGAFSLLGLFIIPFLADTPRTHTSKHDRLV